jgi:hypothetical protein
MNPLRSSLRLTLVGLAALAAAPLAGCDDVTAAPEVTTEQPGETVAVRQPVTVRTVFVADGLAASSDVEVERFFLRVGTLALEPLDPDASTSFASVTPLLLTFSPSEGILELSGPTLQLSHGGRFALTLQAEPKEVASSSKASDSGSMEVSGSWARTILVSGPEREPSPLPWRPKASLPFHTETVETPFRYHSDEVARIQLGEVEFSGEGEFELRMTIDFSSWVRETVVPALRDSAQPVIRAVDGTVDDTSAEPVDSFDREGEGLERLIGTIGVRARAR